MPHKFILSRNKAVNWHEVMKHLFSVPVVCPEERGNGVGRGFEQGTVKKCFILIIITGQSRGGVNRLKEVLHG